MIFSLIVHRAYFTCAKLPQPVHDGIYAKGEGGSPPAAVKAGVLAIIGADLG